MDFLKSVRDSLMHLLGVVWRWLRRSPYAGPGALLLAFAVMLLCQLSGYHEAFMPPEPNPNELPKSWVAPPTSTYFVLYMLAYMRLFVLVGGLAYHVYIIRAWPNVEKMIRPTWVAAIYLAVWAIASQSYAFFESVYLNTTGEVISGPAFIIQVLLLVGLLLSPPFMLMYYARSTIMERYTMRSFLQPLLFCLIAFCTLWVVMDLLDNMSDFQENNIARSAIAMFYVKMIPFIYVTVAPISLLLATVYVLGRMSRTNELISMLGTGKSLGQVLRPIYVAGCYAAFLGMAANYHWAPVSAGNKEQLLQNAKDRISQHYLVMGLVYRNQEAGRSWFVGTVPTDLVRDKMRRVEVRQEDANGKLEKAWFAKSAAWWRDGGIWSLYNGVEVTYKDGKVVSFQKFDFDGTGYSRKDLTGIQETPWVLMSGSLSPNYLGVPDLISYIRANASYGSRKLASFWAHLFYRFALPWQCLVVVMFSAPLAVVFSRRGLVGGIANAVLLFFVLMFLDNLFLNLGRSGRIPPFFAVWFPHLILGTLGVGLFRLRSQNKELPRITFRWIRDLIPAVLQSTRNRSSVKPA
jgi:LPS export ABC transporter permease LptG